MDVRIIVETTADTGNKDTHELRGLSLSSQGCGDLGLKLEDAKDILGQLQKAVLSAQIEDISQAHRRCPDCGRTRRVHDYRTKVLDTLFGRFRVRIHSFARVRVEGESAVRFRRLRSIFRIARPQNF